MKKLAALCVVGFLISGCTTTGGIDQDKIASIVAQVRDATAKACAFLPDVISATAVVSEFYDPLKPAILVVQAVTDAICAAPTTAASVRKGTATYTRIVNTPHGAVPVTGKRY